MISNRHKLYPNGHRKCGQKYKEINEETLEVK